MRVVRVSDPAEFDKVVGELAETVTQLYVVLFGSEDPKTGESWCEDCVVGTFVMPEKRFAQSIGV